MIKEEELIKYLVKDTLKEIKGKKQRIVILRIGSNTPTLEVDFKQIDKNVLAKYLWIGNQSANSPQHRFTTNNSEYLISQTIPMKCS